MQTEDIIGKFLYEEPYEITTCTSKTVENH